MPAVSVVIPWQHDLPLLHHCLAALLTNPGGKPFEVIVVDNRSSDSAGIDESLWENVQFITEGTPGFALSCNAGAQVARGEYLLFLAENTQVQQGWIDVLVRTFELRSDAGIVGGRLLLRDGQQWRVWGIVSKDGSLSSNGLSDDPNRPEFTYLREVDYCSETSMAVRRDVFLEVGGYDAAFARSSYAAVDLAMRVRQVGFSIYYQPFFEVVASTGEAPVWLNPGLSMKCPEEGYRASFVRRWKSVLEKHSGWDGPLDRENDRYVKRRAFCADHAVPTPDKDSGSLRAVNLFAILQEQEFQITFASMGLEARQPYLSDLQQSGVECLYRPFVDSIEEHLKRFGGLYDLVILSRSDTAAELLKPARRWCPRARIVFDTVDLQFRRLGSEATIRHDPRLRRIAERFKRQELQMIAKADVTLVVSEVEREVLAEDAPGADVRVVSNIHRIYGSAASFKERRDMVFVGGFAHPPNTDAVIYFCLDVWPKVLTELPNVRLYVIGSDPPPEVARLAGERVRIMGYVPDLCIYLDSCRISVAPLRFGAGVKGKINQSLAHGLPVVATSAAVDGMFLKDGESALIADDARAFADAVVRLYCDEDLWSSLSRGGLAVMEEHFSFSAARRVVSDLVI